MGDAKRVSITYKNLPEDVKPGDRILIDDGLIGCQGKSLSILKLDFSVRKISQAAIDFIGDSAIRSVLITKLNKDGTYVSGGPGTMITK